MSLVTPPRTPDRILSVSLVLRFEVLGLMGLPYSRLSAATKANPPSARSLTDLAGNAFSTIALVPVLIALFSCLDFQYKVEEPPPDNAVASGGSLPLQACVAPIVPIGSSGSSIGSEL